MSKGCSCPVGGFFANPQTAKPPAMLKTGGFAFSPIRMQVWDKHFWGASNFSADNWKAAGSDAR
jgi:hypothetical protein